MIDSSKYVVLDVETNGTRPKRDDILSISIYKPDDGRMYNRFLPLEKQTLINPDAAAVNGITNDDLRDAEPITQDELDALIVDFELSTRIILAYGGSPGGGAAGFDEKFVLNYLDDHGLYGLEHPRFFNFKRLVFSSPFPDYKASKDNLCIAFGVEGVTSVHSSANDCILEWKLFEKMDMFHYIMTGPNIFRMAHDYIVPASYIDNYSGLKRYLGIESKYPLAETVYELELSREATAATIKFPTNFSGNAIEHLVNSMIGAEKVDSAEFLNENKLRLEYIGSVAPSIEIVHTEHREGGGVAVSSSVYEHAIRSLEEIGGYEALIEVLSEAMLAGRGPAEKLKSSVEANAQMSDIYWSPKNKDIAEELRTLLRHSMLTDSITETNEALEPEIVPLVEFLKKILGTEEVRSQELVVNEADGTLALCDLSSDSAVVEIKTGRAGMDPSECAYQLYISAAGRTCYLMSIDWGFNSVVIGKNTKFIVQRITFLDEKPKRPRKTSDRRRPRIRHAICDWRFENPETDDATRCARELWLKEEEVTPVWNKCDSRQYQLLPPEEGKSDRAFRVVQQWRSDNPEGTRLEMADAKLVSPQTVERWWYAAAIANAHVTPNNRNVIYRGAEYIRDTLLDGIADKRNLEGKITEEDIAGKTVELKELARKVAMFDSSDNLGDELASAADGLRRKYAKAKGELEDLEYRKMHGIGRYMDILRIPQSATKFKTRNYYMYFDPERAYLRYAAVKAGSRAKPVIEVVVTDRIVAKISPRSHVLYKLIDPYVNRRIADVYIERDWLNEREGELIFVLQPDWC
jgi:DNA polymerase III epsilon subunit-like protein